VKTIRNWPINSEHKSSDHTGDQNLVLTDNGSGTVE